MTAATVTLCFLLRTRHGVDEVLLGLKKTGFGAGKIVGLGGHVEPGESVEDAISREIAEEAGVVVERADLIPAGTVDFVFPARPEWNMFTTVFMARSFAGCARETQEIAPAWFPVQGLPLERMWADAGHWLPALLAGEVDAWRIELNGDNETVASCSRTASWRAPGSPAADVLGA